MQTVDQPLEPLRIALFSGAYNHIADGVSLTLNRLVRYLEAEGHEVRIFAPTTRTPELEHAGTLLPTRSVAAPGRPEYRVTLDLPSHARRELGRFQPNLFHIATPDLLGHVALRLAKRHGIPVVASYHTHFSSYLKYYQADVLEGLLWQLLKRFYQNAQQIYVPTPSMADTLRAHGINNLHLWPRGVDTVRFNPDKRSLGWRRSQGIADDEVVVSFVSRLVVEKGLDTLAQVIQALEARGVRHRSLIVGDGPARSELELTLKQTLFTGRLEGEKLARAYASADLFLFPSDTETFGNVVLEAMASGLVCVAADATGSRDLVDHKQTGFLIPVGDVDGFSDSLSELVAKPELRRQLAAAARQKAQTYRWERILAGMVEHYYEVV